MRCSLLVEMCYSNQGVWVCVCVEYLMNVLDDLGLEATDNIKTLLTLLQAAPDQYNELAEQAPQRLAGAVAALRRLKLTQ